MFYLKEKGRVTRSDAVPDHALPAQRSGREDAAAPYVPLGPLDTIEDPRLVRIGNYEDGVTGRHDAARVLGAVPRAVARAPAQRQRVAVLLHDAGSTNKVAQTLLEMVRGGIERLPVDVTVFFSRCRRARRGASPRSLPFAVTTAAWRGRARFAPARRRRLRLRRAVRVVRHVPRRRSGGPGVASRVGRLDAVWGSRRLSVRDIEESYRLRYRKQCVARAPSATSAATCSACVPGPLRPLHLRHAVGRARACAPPTCVRCRRRSDAQAGQPASASALLRRKAEMLEIPVQFFPLSPERVKRTSPLEGFSALATICRRGSADAIAARVRRRAPCPPVRTALRRRSSAALNG